MCLDRNTWQTSSLQLYHLIPVCVPPIPTFYPMKAPPVRRALILLACGMGIGADRNAFLATLCATILGAGATLWYAALPPPRPSPSSSSSAPLSGPSLYRFWVRPPPVDNNEAMGGLWGRRGTGRLYLHKVVLFSERVVWRVLVALASLPSMLDALSQWLLYRLAQR